MKTIFNGFQISRSLMDVAAFLIGQFSASVMDFLCGVNQMLAWEQPLRRCETPADGWGGSGRQPGRPGVPAFLKIRPQISKLVQGNRKRGRDANCQQLIANVWELLISFYTQTNSQ